MLRLLSILVPVLHFEAADMVEHRVLYRRPGQEVVLPCGAAAWDPTCSHITWFYNRNPSETTQVANEKDPESLGPNCSLVISSITAEDAGLYTCRPGLRTDRDGRVYLSVLAISPAPPDADPKRDGNVTLACSLSRYSDLHPCKDGSIRWLDETGNVLLGEGVGFEFLRQTNCVSYVLVKRQSGPNRRYRCEYREGTNVHIEADYTPDFTDENVYSSPGAVVGLLLLLLVIITFAVAFALVKYKKRTKVTEVLQKPADPITSEPGSCPHTQTETDSVTYATVSHQNPKVRPTSQVRDEETVTYSMIRAATADTDNDATHLYSCANPRN